MYNAFILCMETKQFSPKSPVVGNFGLNLKSAMVKLVHLVNVHITRFEWITHKTGPNIYGIKYVCIARTLVRFFLSFFFQCFFFFFFFTQVFIGLSIEMSNVLSMCWFIVHCIVFVGAVLLLDSHSNMHCFNPQSGNGLIEMHDSIQCAAFIMLYAFESVAHCLNDYKSTAVFRSHCHSCSLVFIRRICHVKRFYRCLSFLLHFIPFHFQTLSMCWHYSSRFQIPKFFIMQKWSEQLKKIAFAYTFTTSVEFLHLLLWNAWKSEWDIKCAFPHGKWKKLDAFQKRTENSSWKFGGRSRGKWANVMVTLEAFFGLWNACWGDGIIYVCYWLAAWLVDSFVMTCVLYCALPCTRSAHTSYISVVYLCRQFSDENLTQPHTGWYSSIILCELDVFCTLFKGTVREAANNIWCFEN